MGEFKPVLTLEDLDALDHDEIVAGYREWRPGDPEPGNNHTRSYWHGWKNAARDHGELPYDHQHQILVREWLARERRRHG